MAGEMAVRPMWINEKLGGICFTIATAKEALVKLEKEPLDIW